MIDEFGTYDEKEVINSVVEIDNKINEELDKEKVDNELVCKLRFEQMLKGLYLQAISNQNMTFLKQII